MAESPAELQTEIEKLERKHADHPEGRYFVPLANAYRRLGAVEHAESLLRAGLQRHPEYLSAHIVLGRCLADRQRTAQAEQEFRYVLSLDPQNLIALRTLGDLALEEGRRGEAAVWYRELLAVDPMSDEARQALQSLEGAGPRPTAQRAEPEAVEPAPEASADGALEVGSDSEAGMPAREARDARAGTEAPETAMAGQEEDQEVVTETIAQLYLRQGFYDRAADVYRQLIRRRGSSRELEERLAHAQRLSTAARAEPAAVAPTGAPEVDGAAAPPPAEEGAPAAPALADARTGASPDDAFAASFAHGFDDDAPPAVETAPGPELEIGEMEPTARDPVEAQPAEPSISAYLGELLAWSPSASGGAADPSGPTGGEPVDITALLGGADEERSGVEAAAPDPDTGEPLPWEETVPEPPPQDDAQGLPAWWDSYLEEADEAPATGPDPSAPAAEQQTADEDDEEDLESFQAWLRSLKR